MAPSPLLPPADEQLWLLAALGDLAQQGGTQRLLEAPFVLPSAAFFPDRWTPDEAGVTRLLRRLFGYAGLDAGRLEVEVVRGERAGPLWPGASAHHRGAAGWFRGEVDGVYRFGVDTSAASRPENLVATLAHETAHAWRHRHAVVHPDRDHEERLTDLTTVYLGFGVLNTNAAWQYRAGSQAAGGGWEKQELGYLDFRAFAWLVAAIATARGYGWWERRRLGRTLSPNQRGAFHEACGVLGRRRVEVRAELGLAG